MIAAVERKISLLSSDYDINIIVEESDGRYEISHGDTILIYDLSIVETLAYLRGIHYAVKHLCNKEQPNNPQPMKKKTKDKIYVVSIYMKYAHEVKVKASNKWVAKAVAFARFIKKLKLKDFTIYVDEI